MISWLVVVVVEKQVSAAAAAWWSDFCKFNFGKHYESQGTGSGDLSNVGENRYKFLERFVDP